MVSIGSYSVVTEPLAEADALRLLPNRRMAYDSKQFLYYFRLTSDHRLLFGGRASFTQANENTTRRAAAILRQGINTVFPELARTPLAYAWGGQVSIARDQRPHAGRLGDGTYFAGAYAGHGIAMATLLGDLTARRIGGESVDHPFMDDGCPPIPFYSGTPWFLPLLGAYYRVKDWIS
jgi:glycine/D-amino acid oxidase-like deaminating enzyme